METLKELNKKAWYRFLKIVYIAFFLLSYLFLVVLSLSEFGRDYHPPFYPDSIKVALNDPEFYKVSDKDKGVALSFMDPSFLRFTDDTTQFIEKIKRIDIKTKVIIMEPLEMKGDEFDDIRLAVNKIRTEEAGYLSEIEEIGEVIVIDRGFVAIPRKNPIPQEGTREKYIYASYHTWNIGKSIIFFVIVTLCYSLFMVIIRSVFYYVAIGKLFPKE